MDGFVEKYRETPINYGRFPGKNDALCCVLTQYVSRLSQFTTSYVALPNGLNSACNLVILPIVTGRMSHFVLKLERIFRISLFLQAKTFRLFGLFVADPVFYES